MDLEQEFREWKQSMLDKIAAQTASGELTADEAIDLVETVEERTHIDTSYYGERCPEGHSDPDCGWSPSIGYHC